MKTGTKSVLFGVHQFIIHPITVGLAWWSLYGFPFDPRLWFAFVLHDIGYIGKSKIDDAEGKTHPELGAKIMGYMFGSQWANFVRYHSRSYAKQNHMQFSRLCVADKYSVIMIPKWMYLLLAELSGELEEYIEAARKIGENKTPAEWFDWLQNKFGNWAVDNMWDGWEVVKQHG